tara:strand:- start:1594 stop:2043 length:450 start_codon:yes stop_codon:yes gene_type:complete
MIVFDIQCSNNHVFEGWFADSASYEKQAKKGAVECPVCSSNKVKKAPMAPNISMGATASSAEDSGTASEELSPKEQTSRYMTMLTKMRQHVEANCDYVGDKFAEEARRIHYGETDKHNIYGEASSEESEALRDEGIEFGAIPWPRRPDS